MAKDILAEAGLHTLMTEQAAVLDPGGYPADHRAQGRVQRTLWTKLASFRK